ncbi:GntR family transcriptional regulator [Leucobacter aridicollis]|uniref:GntR family transcriptional regulator n=1 Tax=Leucobacter aridicollis TaxID=283878 RepID=UPI000E648777|nr:GntR family transcriptional regulator [Leucobacter aridicollis]UTX54890.1 GntR family transcriptional regulator [Leucobacter aridicollis]
MLRFPPKTLREQALVELRSLLVSGALKPGEVYSATAIAAELGVSHGPVREAMLSLVNDGMMEVVRNRGFRVVTISRRDRENIAEIRTLLEVPSMMKLAGSPLVRERADEFSTIVDKFFAAAEDEDILAFFDADREFHLGLLALLDNARLTEFIGTLRDQTRQYGIYELAVRGELAASAQDHRNILDALLDGDVEAVERLMLGHLQYLRWSRWTFPDLEASVEPDVEGTEAGPR